MVMPLLGDNFTLTGDPLDPVQKQEVEKPAESARIIRRKGTDGGHWFVLAPAEKTAILINGVPLVAGIRVLRDRDEIRLSGADRLFFSTECLASAEPFPGLGQAVFCPRCKQEIAPQSDAVKCPQCEAWHHQSAEFPCWTYSERCALCDQLSNLDAGYRWTPESL